VEAEAMAERILPSGDETTARLHLAQPIADLKPLHEQRIQGKLPTSRPLASQPASSTAKSDAEAR
jgi:hypothetical protein